MSEQLKRCPFCGHKFIQFIKYDSSVKSLYRCMCDECKCGTNWELRQQAIETWNKRAC